MWTAKWILDDYEEGGQALRSEMYMNYRDLRACFDEMDARPRKAVEQAAERNNEKHVGAWWSHCCRLVRG